MGVERIWLSLDPIECKIDSEGRPDADELLVRGCEPAVDAELL